MKHFNNFENNEPTVSEFYKNYKSHKYIYILLLKFMMMTSLQIIIRQNYI